ncbi:hypothetical protein BC835DRAFT_1307566 [Cytidiella melzeri]|nr:hypothetical protein BC835DRAFT_1307566 [Cytidiella melzeri]
MSGKESWHPEATRPSRLVVLEVVQGLRLWDLNVCNTISSRGWYWSVAEVPFHPSNAGKGHIEKGWSTAPHPEHESSNLADTQSSLWGLQNAYWEVASPLWVYIGRMVTWTVWTTSWSASTVLRQQKVELSSVMEVMRPEMVSARRSVLMALDGDEIGLGVGWVMGEEGDVGGGQGKDFLLEEKVLLLAGCIVGEWNWDRGW